jgi:phage terminase large subunit-like protein
VLIVATDLDRYLDDPMAFRREQLILEDGRRLGDALDDWQVEDVFAPMDTLQDDGRFRYRLTYYELPRGHAKTTMVGGEAVTQLVLASAPNWRGHIAAGDKDQARELFQAAAGFITRNPYLAPAFTIKRDRIVSNHTTASLRIHSADAPTAHGLIVDWFAIDEFWNQPTRDLFDAFYTAAVKRPNWRGVILTTAGFDKQTICWEVRELARKRMSAPPHDFYASSLRVASRRGSPTRRSNG